MLILSPSECVIILTIIIACIVLFISLLKVKRVRAVTTIPLPYDINMVFFLLKHIKNYDKWWDKLKNFHLYKIQHNITVHSNSSIAKIVILIKSNNSQEEWILILRKTSYGTKLIISQNYKLLSKFAMIVRLMFCYKTDVKSFKKSIKKALNNLSYVSVNPQKSIN